MEIAPEALFAKVGQLTIINEMLTAENAALKARIAELEQAHGNADD